MMWNNHVIYTNTYPCNTCWVGSCLHNGFLHLRERIDIVFHGDIICAMLSADIGCRTVVLVDHHDRDIVYNTIELDEEEACGNWTKVIYVIPTHIGGRYVEGTTRGRTRPKFRVTR